MKNLLFILGFTLLFSCSRNGSKSNEDILNSNVRIIDSCEYLQFETSVPGSNTYNYTITHKGNCSNLIHKKTRNHD